jgi:hypothetical protein
MRLFNINGKLVNKNVSKYIIDWDKKSRSLPQWKMKQFLKPYWDRMIVYEEFPVFSSLLKVDIFNATLKIAIEINGEQHYGYHYFHNKSPSNYLKSIKNDVKKEQWLLKNDIKLIEIKDSEVNMLSKSFLSERFNLIL